MMRTDVVEAMIASSSPRAHYPRGEEVKDAIEQVGESVQAVVPWLQTMNDDELAHLQATLRRSLELLERERGRRDGR